MSPYTWTTSAFLGDVIVAAEQPQFLPLAGAAPHCCWFCAELSREKACGHPPTSPNEAYFRAL